MRHYILGGILSYFLLFESAHAAESRPQPADTYTLEAITVTATKREQALREIAGSVSTASDIDLENQGAETLQDATKMFPNVHMKSTSSGNEIVIRGMSTWDTALHSPAGLYVDGVPYPLSYMQNIYLHDMEGIEVLRGPQGTLYGRNSESGVINLVRRTPDNKLRGSLFTEFGNHNTFRLGASAAGPLLEDKVYFSGSYLRHQTDGFVRNEYKQKDQAARHKADSGRVVLRLTPTDALDVRMSLDATHSDDGIGSMRLSTGPYRSGRYKVRSDAPDEASSDLVIPAFTITHTGEHVRTTSITSYLDYKYKMLSDLDRTPLPLGVSDMSINQRNISEELRFSSVGKQKLSWVAGLFLGKTSMNTDMNRIRRRAAATTYLHTDYTETTGALFGQATYAITDVFRLTAGLRAEYTGLDGEQTYKTGAGQRRAYEKGFRYTEFLPMASASLDVTDNLTTYASWSQGYLPGGFNVFSASSKDTFYYKPEYSTNYELGLKTHWLDNKLQANVSAFYSDIRDKQVREEVPSAGIGTWKFTNSAKAHTSGVELEVRAYPLEGWELRGGVGYARSEIDEWTVSTPSGGRKNYSGNRLPWAPDLTYHLGVGYTHSSGFFAQAEYLGSGKQYFDAENTLSDPGYNTVNLQFGYRGENITVAIWGKNVFDTHYITKKLVANGNKIVEDGNPFSFGTTVSWSF
jgi:iron complex outermembrane receptor protein